MEDLMHAALAKLSAMVKAYFPADLRAALMEYGKELDRLRAEVDELRSKLKTKE